MTEAEWLACEDPARMLVEVRKKISERKLRLFGCACCRDVEFDLNQWSLACLAVREAHADGEATAFEIREYNVERTRPQDYMRWTAEIVGNPTQDTMTARRKRQSILLRDIVGNPFRAVTLPCQQVQCERCRGKGHVRMAEIYASRWDRKECGACRGTGKVPGPCPWLLWQDGTVPRLAEAIYQGRDWERLPILADALEEAGAGGEACAQCNGEGKRHWQAKNAQDDLYFRYMTHAGYDREAWMEKCEQCCGTGHLPHPLVAHLRGAGPHCRGCHVLDLLTGRV